MAHPKETRNAVRAAYIGGMPLEQAAQKARVPEGTARRWKAAAAARGDDWDKFQHASLIVSGGGFDQAMGRVAAAVLLRCEALMERLADDKGIDPLEATKAVASLADSLTKAQAASKRLMPEVDKYAVAVEVLKRLAEHVIARKPGPVAAELVGAIEGFGAELGTTWGA